MAFRWMQRLTRRSVVVHLTTGASIRGVLVGVYRDALVMAHASYLGGEAVEPVDGEVTVPRERVAWLQSLGGGE